MLVNKINSQKNKKKSKISEFKIQFKHSLKKHLKNLQTCNSDQEIQNKILEPLLLMLKKMESILKEIKVFKKKDSKILTQNNFRLNTMFEKRISNTKLISDRKFSPSKFIFKKINENEKTISKNKLLENFKSNLFKKNKEEDEKENNELLIENSFDIDLEEIKKNYN